MLFLFATQENSKAAPDNHVPQSGLQLSSYTGYGWATAGVSLATVVFWFFRTRLDPGQASLLYMPVVIACASRYGFGPAMFGAALSFFSWDYFFLPPSFTIFVNSSRNWISLAIFFVAAVTTAHLAATGRNQAKKAQARELETLMLYEASQAISQEIEVDRLLLALVEQVVQICRASRCLVLKPAIVGTSLEVAASAGVSVMGPLMEAGVRKIAQSAMQQNRIIGLDAGTPISKQFKEMSLPAELLQGTDQEVGLYLPLDMHGTPVGVLFVGPQRDGRFYTDQEKRLVMTMANHAAVVIARQELAESAKLQARQTAVLDERNRLAEEVHDTLSHSFTGIKFLLEAATRIEAGPAATECVMQARDLAIEGAKQARRSVWALRPVRLEETGDLASAIREMAQRDTSMSGLNIDVQIQGTPAPLGDAAEENLLRICQEAITNVLRHARAINAEISLCYESQGVVLSIKDDGIGIPEEAAGNTDGFGMTSMKARAGRIGGTLSIGSRHPQGTEITISMPISIENQE